ncbi:MAG: uroporphyrinogen decarboxylase [Pseudomonadota bacterium]|nr:uroporphyrinogen decarboxylase [Pseudomonadota bacterium]
MSHHTTPPPHTSSKSDTTALTNDLLIRCLEGQQVERPPIWLMRQAGRYLDEYRQIRKQFPDFLDLCHTPQATTELALQPVKRFDLDAAILFSDILTIPHALDLGLSFDAGQGPIISSPIQTPEQVFSLPFDEVIDRCQYVFRAVRHLRMSLKQSLPLIGFAGSPWTLCCYSLQGKSCANFPQAKAFAYEHPVAMQELINQLTQVIAVYLAEQAKAGADVLFIIDTWGSLLPYDHYELYVLEPLKQALKIIRETHKIHQPILFYSKGISLIHHGFFQSLPYNIGVAVDWTHQVGMVQKQFKNITVQGNLDPHVLLAGPVQTSQHTHAMLDSLADPHHHFIASLGHGVLQQTPVESVHAFIDAVRSYRQE